MRAVELLCGRGGPGADPVGAGGGDDVVDGGLAVVEGRDKLAPPATASAPYHAGA